ncbi:MAG: SCP2 sterol-binding domain-containing protein [Thermoplasmataceae archaeon]|jgi:putative sterol carrier protein
MKETLESLRKRVLERINSDEKFKNKLMKVDKKFLVEFEGKNLYNFSIKEGNISEIMEGPIDADVTISMDSDTFNKIMSKEMDPMEAYFEKKIRIKASLLDKLFLTDLFK